jgi:hypothetical protein
MSILNSNFKLKLNSTFKLDLELRIELDMNLSQRDPTQRVLDYNDIITACSGARNFKTASFKHGG